MVNLPYPLSNGTTADGAEVYADIAAVNDQLSLIKNANIPEGAAISKRKLAEPSSAPDAGRVLLPPTAGDDLTAIDEFAVPEALTTFLKERVRLRSGQAASLCEVEWYVASVTPDSGTNVVVSLLVNGVQVGGQSIPITTADAFYTFQNANPIDNELLPLADGDILEWQFGKDGSGAATIAGVTARLNIKREHVPQ